MAINMNQNFPQNYVLGRKAMLHNLAADNFLSSLLTFVNGIVGDWSILDKNTLENKVKAIQKTVRLAFISNQNTRQYILASVYPGDVCE